MAYEDDQHNNEACTPQTDPHSLEAWMRLRGDTFDNQLQLVVNMSFQMGPCGITATQVREAIANTPSVARKFGVSSPAARLSSAKKAGILHKIRREGEREGAYVHAAYLYWLGEEE